MRQIQLGNTQEEDEKWQAKPGIKTVAGLGAKLDRGQDHPLNVFILGGLKISSHLSHGSRYLPQPQN
jgi:hypothetical protein